MPPGSKEPPTLEPGSDTTKDNQEEQEHSSNYPAKNIFRKETKSSDTVTIAGYKAEYTETPFFEEGDKIHADWDA
jgi:hypothetical protein